MARLQLFLLGPPEMALDGRPVAGLNSDKVRALLFYLAVEGGRAHRRESLAGLLWPDYPERSAHTNLSNALSNLRTALGDREATPPFFHVSREAIQFNAHSDCRVDAAAFEELVARDEWEKAIALYRGPFLEGFSIADSPPFEQWALVQRERLGREVMEALGHLAAQHEELGNPAGAIAAARRQLEIEPWHEEGHRALMRLLALSGQRSAALAQYEACARRLMQELGVEPSPETVTLYEQIRDGRLTPEGAESRSEARTDLPRHNLPAQLTSFVGREDELAGLDRLLCDPGVRLVTVLGLGGSGKTRLALETAARQLGRYPNGVRFVSLAPLQSVGAIVPTVAQALGFSFYGGGEPKEQLLNYLRQKNLLLVLDNYEHLVEGAGLVPDILHAAPEVKALVTSRSALNVQGESLYPVSGMHYPSLTPGPPPDQRRGELVEDALRHSAVRLFVDSARRARPGFELTGDNLADVVRICHLVAGMPLAILLAAAWLKVLAPAEIADQIAGGVSSETAEGLDLLASDLRDMPERQRSMRAVFDHSWSLLPEGQQAVMGALSVFRGGCIREAAQAVSGASLRDLMSLVDRSLLQRTAAPSATLREASPWDRTGGRFEMHELLRQYAAEKLDRSPEAGEVVRDRHCACYTSALQRWAADLKGPRQQAAMAEMEADVENARAAWAWAVERGQVERLGQAMDGLGHFYEDRARYQEGESAFRMAAERLAGWTDGSPEASASRLLVRVRALTWQNRFCQYCSHWELARDLLRQSLDLLDSLTAADTRRERAFALYMMGKTEHISSNLEKARPPFNQALALYRALDQRWEIAETLSALGQVVQSQGEFDRAKGLYQEALVLRRELGDQRGVFQSLMGLSAALESLGQFEEAEWLQQEGLSMAREMGDRHVVCMGLLQRAYRLMRKGQFAEGRLLLEEGIQIATTWAPGFVAYYFSLNVLGMTIAHLGQYNAARIQLQENLAGFQESNLLDEIGFASLGLGHVALAEEQYADAQHWLRESLAAFQEWGARSEVGWPLALLAGVARGLGRLSEARERLCEALQIAAEIRDLLTATYGLPVAALLLADRGEAERAVEIYALASRYGFVAHSRLWEDVAGRQMAALAATLPPEVVAAAQERGRNRDLWATVQELLAELKEGQRQR